MSWISGMFTPNFYRINKIPSQKIFLCEILLHLVGGKGSEGSARYDGGDQWYLEAWDLF